MGEGDESPHVLEEERDLPDASGKFVGRRDELRQMGEILESTKRTMEVQTFRVPGEEGPANPTDPMAGSLIDSPFDNLEVTEKGKILTVRMKPQDPTTKVKEQAESQGPSDPETEKMMQEAFKDLRFTFRITAPFKVASHNATRKEGDTLVWEYDLAKMQQLRDDAASAKPMEVSYRR